MLSMVCLRFTDLYLFIFFTVVVLTEQMHQLPAAKTDTDNQHPGIQH